MFFDKDTFQIGKKKVELALVPSRLRGDTAGFDIKAGKRSSSRPASGSPRGISSKLEESRRQQARSLRISWSAAPLPMTPSIPTGELLAKANDEIWTETIVEAAG